MLRRSILRTTALAAVLIAPMAACTTGQIQTVEAQALSDLSLVSSGIQAFGPLFSATTGVSATAVAAAEAIISDITAAAATISSATTDTAAQPVVTKIEGYVTALLSIAGQYTLPANVSAILVAAKALLPVIEAAVGIVIAAAPANGMMPTQARQILAAA